MKKPPVLLIGIIGILACFIAIIKLDLVYDAETMRNQNDISVIVLPVERFLQNSTLLPPPGTELVRRNGNLEWVNLPAFASRIANVHVSSVRFTSGAPLLSSILDDDPTYSIEVVATVTTVDGKQIPLRLTFWDYGLVTPWFVQSRGDGLKPVSVSWN